MSFNDLLLEYKRKTPKSAAHYEKAKMFLAGGVSGSAKFAKPNPIYMKSASGCKFEDLDGNEYIDMMMGNGVSILGHGNEKIRKAVNNALDNPPFTFLGHEYESMLAEKICRSVPSMERIRFANSGSEAVYTCVRAALAYTKRKKVAKFEGNFNGGSDLMLSSPDMQRPGILQSNLENVLVLPFNDTENSVALIKKHADEIAAVILEPVTGFVLPAIPCDIEFLKAIRKVTSECGIVLIFDEIVTGFRLAMGGAAEFFQVKPDMQAMGKALCGGYPIACFGGSKEIMEKVVTPTKEPSDLVEKIFHSGTFTGHPVSCAAALAVLQELEKGEVIPHINSSGDYMRASIKEIARRVKCPVQVTGCGSMFGVYFADHEVRNKRDAIRADTKKRTEFSMRLFLKGIYLPDGKPALLSYAHTKKDLDHVLSVIEEILPS